MLTTFAKSHTHWYGCFIVGILASAPAVECTAQSDGDAAAFHAAYAAMFGTGVYQPSDGTEAEVFRANFSKRLRATPDVDGAGPGVRLSLPVTAGRQKRADDDLSLDGATERIEYAAFLPGIELELTPTERWTLRTRAQAGRGWQLNGAEVDAAKPSADLAAVGVRSRLMWSDAPGRPALINGLLWAGIDPSDGERDSLLRFTTALELDIGVPRWTFRGEPMRLRPHVLRDWYYRPPPALAFGDDAQFERVGSEWQVGVAARREQGFKVWFFKFEAVGIAYRFSDYSEGLRVYLNSVF
jgi:hypothetical protein